MHHTNLYRRFVIMIGVSFALMYVLMYAMVDALPNALSNINELYMAGLMTAAMGLIEISVMWSMYPDPRRNITILGLSFLILLSAWTGIRHQTLVTDEQFLRSMIPHHASALLMCKQATLVDPEIKSLCEKIISGQQTEIDWMKEKLSTY